MGGTIDILGVDHEKEYRDLYSGWLGADHDVTTVSTGAAAIESLTSETDLVLLERSLPDLSGRNVAASVHESVDNCHVVMVSERPADFDIVEYPIESYVRKPLNGSDLDGIVERVETQQYYQSALEEYFRLLSKLGAIETELSAEELSEDDRYERLQRRAEEKREEVDEAISTGDTDWHFTFKSTVQSGDHPAQASQ